MEQKSFSVYDAMIIGLRNSLNNFRLFFLALLSMLGLLFLGMVVVGIINIGFFNKLAVPIKIFFDFVHDGLEASEISVLKSLIWQTVGKINVLVFVSSLLVLLFWQILLLGYTKLSLEVHDKGSSTVVVLFSGFRYLPRYFVACALYCAMVALGLLLFIVPGIYWAIRFGYFRYFIVDKQAGIVDSLKASFAATRGQVWDLIALWISLGILYGIGNVSRVGSFITFPAATLAYIAVYRQLVPKGQTS